MHPEVHVEDLVQALPPLLLQGLPVLQRAAEDRARQLDTAVGCLQQRGALLRPPARRVRAAGRGGGVHQERDDARDVELPTKIGA